MEDKELKREREDIEVPHTLGGASYILLDSSTFAEVGESLAKVELRKPRKPFVCVK